MALLRMVTPRSVDLNQLRGVFLSEALSARPELLRGSLASILTAHGARPTAYVFLTRGRAEDVLAEQTPLFGARLSKSQAAQTRELTQRGVAPQITLSTFYARLTTPGRSAAAALCAVNGMQYLDSPPPHGRAIYCVSGGGAVPQHGKRGGYLRQCGICGRRGLLSGRL